jgi:hypothetical protein
MGHGERPSREEKRYMTEAMALGSALQDALRDLVKVHGVNYLDTFLSVDFKAPSRNCAATIR